MKEEVSDPKEDDELTNKELDRDYCIMCIHLDGLECDLLREEDFTNGKDCPRFINWWKN